MPKPRPNPFYRPDLPALVRRRFLGLMGLLLGGAALGGAETALPKASAEEPRPRKGGGKGGQDTARARGPSFKGDYVLPASLAAFAEVSVVLGRTTRDRTTVSVVAARAMEGYVEYGLDPAKLDRRTAPMPLPAREAAEFELRELRPDTRYHYRLHVRPASGGAYQPREVASFSTQRAPGSTFVFTVQGDSHPERPQSSHPELYARTLQAAAADRPDFHVCIGDDFSVDKVPVVTPQALAAPYHLQRPFLGLVGRLGPVFLVNGNHEQASRFNYDQKDERRDVAIGAQRARNRLYPLPSPDGFYTGNETPLPEIGPLRDYHAWTWGDALFVILDNYWHSPALVDSGFGPREAGGKRDRDGWAITIGDTQYRWLKRTLETSKARHKFVFAHHVMGTGRGGVELAHQHEWGGQGRGGDGTFATRRPGWELPIHQLMAKHKVSVFFQGHDHLYCRQEKDGVTYQELPMPSDHGYVAYNEDRYAGGTKLPNAGHLRVTVSPDKVKVEYVRAFLAKDEAEGRRHGAVAHAYEIPARA